MKKILSFVPFAALLLLLTGCYTNVIDLDEIGGDGDGDGDGSNQTLVIQDRSQLEQQIFAESRICEVTFTTQNGWNVEIVDEQMRRWVTPSPAYSENGGMYTLSISVDENSTGQERTAVLRLFSNGESETITIHQSPRLSDGSVPPPYEKDTYTDRVERISFQEYYAGEALPILKEWRFLYTPQESIYNMALFLVDNIGEGMEQQINILDYNFIVQDIYGLIMPEERYDVIRRIEMETTVNEYNFITHQVLREFNFQNGGEPNVSNINIRYSNYRMVAERLNEYSTNEYQWEEGNMVAQKETNSLSGEANTRYRFDYSTVPNDKANIDLNAFLSDNMYAAAGLLGKRSQMLLTSISDNKGGMKSFVYTFDGQGRVETIARNHSFNGTAELATTLFTIHYADDNNSSENGRLK